MKDNRGSIEKALWKNSLSIGVYDTEIDKISQKEINKVVAALSVYCTIDIPVIIRKKIYIVECMQSDEEVDLMLRSKDEYIKLYGISEEDFNEKFGELI